MGKSVEDNTSKVYVGTGVMAPGAGGSALFVINLCASIAPVQTSGRNLPGLDNYKLYQVARVEDGRTRHRLRLGFFTSESHAESVLTVVRQQYPTAFTTSLCDEDRRFARGYLPGPAAAPAPAPAPVRPVAVVAPAPAPAPAVAPARPVAAVAPAQPATPPTAKARPTPPPATVKAPTAPAPAPAVNAPAPIVKVPVAPAPTPAASTPASRTLSRAEPEPVELSWEPAPSKSAAPPAPAPAIAAQAPTTTAPKATPASATTSTRMRALALSEPAKTVEKKPAAPASKTASSMRVPALSLAEPPPPPSAEAKAATNEPFRVSKGVAISDSGLRLHAETPTKSAKPAVETPAAKAASAVEPPAAVKVAAPRPAIAAPPAKPAPAIPAKPAASVSKPAAKTPALPPAAAKIPARPSLQNSGFVLPELDTTQTIRALTTAELNDDGQEKFYAIQLAATEQPVNLDTMPRLDIFEAYRLYSVAIAGSGKITHSLRLGFFKEEMSAEAVCGYLNAFFGSPTTLRVSTAEHARFKDAPQPKPAADSSRQEAKVVEINNARTARPIPTVSDEVPTLLDTGATGTFNPNATGAFKPNATGAFKKNGTGTHKTLTPKLKPAAKSSGAATKSGPAGRNGKTSATGKHQTLQPKKSLSEQLLDEAREVQLSESGIRRLPPKNDSLLSRLVDKLTK